MFKAVTKCLICYFRVRKWLGALLEAWKYFWPRVGFGLLTISHVFDFWDCVPRNLETGVAPLRAYRKTIQFRPKFRLIRSPEAPRKPIQPDTKIPFQPGIRLDFWLSKKFALGNQPLGRIPQTARADLFFCQKFCTRVLFWLEGLLLQLIYGFSPLLLPNRNHTLSL